MDNDNLVDKLPSVRTIIQYGDKRGNLYLSSLYGSYNVISEIKPPKDEIVIFFCPHCNAALTTKFLCDECNAPMVAFEFIGGSKILICSRKGCKKHFIEFEDLEKQISAFYSAYPLFFYNSREKKEKKK